MAERPTPEMTAPARRRIDSGWSIAATPAGSCTTPAELAAAAPEWVEAGAGGTVAACLARAGRWQLDGPPRRFDAEDWWFRVEFDAPGEPAALCFDGLAGLAEAWLDGEPLLASDNSFLAHEVDVRGRLRAAGNRLLLRFAALDAELAKKRPRPRWRAPMVEQQQLRWVRTTVLGRTPGWSLPAAPVGPWRPVWLRGRPAFGLARHAVQATLEGTRGRIAFEAELHAGAGLQAAELRLVRHGRTHRAALAFGPGGTRCTGALEIDGVDPWWPHTHGEPALYEAFLHLQPREGAALDAPLGRVGFRCVEVDRSDGGFALRVNGVPVFCRGACWTPLDAVGFDAPPAAYEEALAGLRDAGMNMLRVGGTMVYEPAAFFDACDAAGVLVWQEFMFASMDFPAHDERLLASVQAEARQQLALWQGHACVAVVCGNSEVEQQAAMWGATREHWQPPLFHEVLPALVRELLPGVPYWPSSAHGGAFPHQADQGTTSYYGVGAYLRGLDDARRAGLRFATECLAFANVPDAEALARMPGGLALRAHHPAWKARTPRDLGAGWDFEDVRDHYVRALFDVDPVRCRGLAHEHYLALGRAAVAEAMGRAFDEWRRPGSRCGGALVWFLRDFWAGAGWGVLDEQGAPKSAWHALRRALQPVALSLSDEGGNGLHAHLVNDRAEPLEATLRITLHGADDQLVAQHELALRAPARGGASVPLLAAFEGFLDLTHAYRFGPAPAAVVHAQLVGHEDRPGAEAFYFPGAPGLPPVQDLGLAAAFVDGGGAGRPLLEVSSRRCARWVNVAVPGHRVSDNHFHLAPGQVRRIALAAVVPGAPLRAEASALNGDRVVAVRDVP